MNNINYRYKNTVKTIIYKNINSEGHRAKTIISELKIKDKPRTIFIRTYTLVYLKDINIKNYKDNIVKTYKDKILLCQTFVITKDTYNIITSIFKNTEKGHIIRAINNNTK